MDATASFHAHLVDTGASPATVRAYESDLSQFSLWFEQSTGEGFTPDAATPTVMFGYRDYLHATARMKPATINRRLATLRRYFDWARREGLSSTNPTVDVTNIPETPAAPRSIPRNELNRLTRTVERYGNPRDLALIQMLRYTGLRRCEIVALRLDDLPTKKRGGVVAVRGKGMKYREVPLHRNARRSLLAYLDVRADVDDQAVFLSSWRRGISEQTVLDIVKKYAYRAGLEDVTPHILRHSFAHELAREGENLAIIKVLLGHERLETTLRYSLPQPEELANAVDSLE